MRSKRRSTALVDADKDIDTNDSTENGNINEPSYRSSPPPLPELIFNAPPHRPNSKLVGSITSLEDEEQSALNGNEVSDAVQDKTESLSLTDNRNPIDFNSNSELNGVDARNSISHCETLVNQREDFAQDNTKHRRSFPSHTLGHFRNCGKPDRGSLCEGRRYSNSRRRATSYDGKLNTPLDIASSISSLRKERSKLLQEIELEDKERSTFYTKLESLNQKLRNLPLDYNVGCERWSIEGDMYRIQDAMVKRLGSPSVMLRRRDQRLHTINAIEKTIQRLRQDSTSSNNNMSTSKETDPTNPSQAAMDFLNANQVKLQDGRTVSDACDLRPINQTPPSEAEGGLTDTQPLMHPTIEAVLKGNWPFEKALWHSSPASMGLSYQAGPDTNPNLMSTSSVTNRRAQSQQQLLSNKVEMVYGLLSMFSSGDKDTMSRTLLAMSSSPDSCLAMRQSGCLPLLIQLLHGGDDNPPTREARLRASQALHNIVHSHPDDKRGRREARVLRLLEQIRDYSDYLYEQLERTCAGRGPLLEDDKDRHPCPTMAALMKLSFDEDHRHAMCSLGGLHAITELIRRDHEAHGSTTADQYCITLRRYAGMALTNLTFGDGTNKALLCSFRCFMKSLVSQLHSPSEDLRQVTASVLRNLSWRADSGSKASLREVGSVKYLMEAALTAKKESTLKVILSAVWNLSAHCSMNKADICDVEGALSFLCSTLTYKSQSKTLSIVENGGGILRNISSHIAVREELRQILRDNNALSILLTQLRSPSLTVVSNACGTLWNLSARCQKDQKSLWELGAVPMLKSLMNSKHKMISMGSSAALKNLLQAKPDGISLLDQRNGGLPTLQARKQRALVQELDPTLSETCDNIETSPRASPTSQLENITPMYHSMGHPHDFMTESRETIASTHSDRSHDRRRLKLEEARASREELREADLTDGFCGRTGSDGNLRGSDKLHSKVSMLGDKYCNGHNRKRDHSGSRRSSAKSSVSTLEEQDLTTDFGYRYSEEMVHDGHDADGDTIKMFCTEGTPQIVSSAGSMTDLTNGRQARQKEKISKLSLCPKEMDDIEIEDLEENTDDGAKKRVIKEENPVSYCVEDTPVSLSRFSSVSSLSSGEMNDHIDKELLDDEDDTEQLEEPDLKDTEVIASNPSVKRSLGSHTPSESRVPMCDETPLMFSRSSSLGSLDSCDAHSINDERNSVISSRFTSGMISPSDLPDSPSQTVPTSPKHVKHPKSIASRVSHGSSGIFKDVPKTFMLEGSPNLSVGTSLSSLTFDTDEPFVLPNRSGGDGKDSSKSATASETSQGIPCPNVSYSRPESRTSDRQSRNGSERPTNLPRNSRSISLGRDQSDEKKLAAVIQSGMPTRKTPTGPRAMISPSLQCMPLPPPPKMGELLDNRPSAIPIKTANLTVTVESINLAPPTSQNSSFNGSDTIMNFCTEDTPANGSHAGSMSDLSQLSFQTDSSVKAKSSKSSKTPQSDHEEDRGKKLLEKCIQSGMPKQTRGIVRPKDPKAKAKTPLARPPVQKPQGFGVNRPTNRAAPVARVKPAIKTESSPLPLKSPGEAGGKRLPSMSKIATPRSISASRIPQKPPTKEDQMETPTKYNVENTPAQLSRHSSLSSIGIEDDRSGTRSTKPDSVKKFGVENTPVCFSRNSSLSSLSVASYEDETTPREQALLQRCISKGMPKTKSDLEETFGKKPTSRIPSLRSPAKASPGLPMPSPLVTAISSSAPVSSDSESESRKLRTDVAEKEKSQSMTSSSSSEGARTQKEKPEANHSESSISDSQILAEALQLALSDKLDDVSQSMNSETLENIMPPSAMSSVLSLSSSTNGFEEKKKLECRHTKMPKVVRRALGDQDGGGSMVSSCHSNIDNIQPPSLMMEDDMESSMVSVASITSEVMDPKESPPGNTYTLSKVQGNAHQVADFLLQDTVSSAKTIVADEASTYQEVTEIPDETLAAGTISDTEGAELDQDVPELPLDSPAKYASPRVTPKSRRSLLRDRVLSGASDSSSYDSSRSNSPKSPKLSRRSLEPDRFKTRTIRAEELSKPTTEVNGNFEVEERSDTRRSSFKQRRHDNPTRYLTRTIETPVTALSDQHEVEDSGMVDFQDADLTPQQLEVLSQDANMVICSLNEAREATNDAAELFQEENIMDIETLSLISNDEEDELMQQIEDDVTRRRPRIVKPGEETVMEKEEEPPVGKVIRTGRRKQSSGRHQNHVACSTKGSLPTAKVTPVVAKPQATNVKLPRPTRASTLRQNSNKTEDGRTTDSTPGSSAGSSPKITGIPRTAQTAARQSHPPQGGIPQLQRQNTFTKEDKKAALEKVPVRRPVSGPGRVLVRPKVRKEDARANERTC